MAKKAYVGVPNEYTVLSYIQSSGTQYIDTGFKPNQDTRVTMDLKVLSVSNATTAVFGQRNETNAQDPTAYIFYIMQSGATVRSDYLGSNKTVTLNIVNQRVVIDKNKNICTVGGTVLENSSANGQGLHNLYLLTLNDAGKPVSTFNTTAIVYSCKIYDNGTLVRDFVPVRNASGAVGLYDRVFHAFYENKGSGSFTAGSATGEKISESGVARQVKKLYIGVNGIARKIKKAYVGVAGVARLFWQGRASSVGYKGTITSLSTARSQVKGASNKTHAFFIGGIKSNGYSATSEVEAYNESLTKSTASATSGTCYYLPAAAQCGDYLLVSCANGMSSMYTAGENNKKVDAYNASLTKSSATELDTYRKLQFAVGNDDYALIGGGSLLIDGYTEARNTVNAYSSSLVKSMVASLPARIDDAPTVFTGTHYFVEKQGSSWEASASVAYDLSLTQTTISEGLTNSRDKVTAATIDGYALFACGGKLNSYIYTVDIYDPSLTRLSPINLRYKHGYAVVAVSLPDFVVLSAGYRYESNGSYSIRTEAIDPSFTISTLSNLGTLASIDVGGAAIGDYAIFAGGKKLTNSTTATASTVTNAAAAYVAQ